MSNEMLLKYGCNPNQKPSKIYINDGSELPIEVINGRPGYINLLDAFNGWQLVKELRLLLVYLVQHLLNTFPQLVLLLVDLYQRQKQRFTS